MCIQKAPAGPQPARPSQHGACISAWFTGRPGPDPSNAGHGDAQVQLRARAAALAILIRDWFEGRHHTALHNLYLLWAADTAHVW